MENLRIENLPLTGDNHSPEAFGFDSKNPEDVIAWGKTTGEINVYDLSKDELDMVKTLVGMGHAADVAIEIVRVERLENA